MNDIGIVWAYDDVWEVGYRHALEFYSKYGHLKVPLSYVCEDNYSPGGWINNKRADYQASSMYNTLAFNKTSRLDKIDMIGDVKESMWQAAYDSFCDIYTKTTIFIFPKEN